MSSYLLRILERHGLVPSRFRARESGALNPLPRRRGQGRLYYSVSGEDK